MTESIGISYVNFADAATLTGGSWQAALPLANLQTPLMAAVARSTDATITSTKFQIDLGSGFYKTQRILALVRHNISAAGTYRVKAGTTPGGLDLYDSGSVSAWPAIYLPGDLQWEDANWWTGVPDDVTDYPMALWHDVGQNINGRYWTVEITDTTNSAGYVQASRVWLGDLWSPQHSYEFGAGFGWEAHDDEEESLGGVMYFTARPSRRVFSFSFGALSYQEAFGKVLEIQRVAKNSGQVVIIPNSADQQYFFKRNLLARFRRMDPLKQLSHNIQGAAFEAEEVL